MTFIKFRHLLHSYLPPNNNHRNAKICYFMLSKTSKMIFLKTVKNYYETHYKFRVIYVAVVQQEEMLY